MSAIGFELADVCATAGHDLHQPGSLQGTQRFAHRVARDAELFGETICEQPLARRQITLDDHLADLVGDDLPKRAVRAADGHAVKTKGSIDDNACIPTPAECVRVRNAV